MFLELAIVAGVRLSPTKVTLLGGFRGICGKIKTRLVTLLHVTCYNKVVTHGARFIMLNGSRRAESPKIRIDQSTQGGLKPKNTHSPGLWTSAPLGRAH